MPAASGSCKRRESRKRRVKSQDRRVESEEPRQKGKARQKKISKLIQAQLSMPSHHLPHPPPLTPRPSPLLGGSVGVTIERNSARSRTIQACGSFIFRWR